MCARAQEAITGVRINGFVQSWPHLIHGFKDPQESAAPNGISIGSAVFTQHICETRPTHGQTYRQTDTQIMCDICSSNTNLMHCVQAIRSKIRLFWAFAQRLHMNSKGRVVCFWNFLTIQL